MKFLVVIAVIAAVGGCTAVRGTGERFLSDEEISQKDDRSCTDLGAVKGTQVYIDCRLRLRSDRSVQDTMRRFGS
jgi:hypothetical protein